jgi:phosphonate transport system substrate-binding protein
MSEDSILLLGAIAYDPKVIAIWDGFARYFVRHGLAFDYVLYSNYERQVEAHFSGHIHVAWNSPLAWLQSERIAEALGGRAEAICMRDTDLDLTSVIIVRSDSGIHDIGGLKGKRVAVGAKDSPQATLIPLSYLAAERLKPDEDFEVIPFDTLVGKHGDHIGGERDAVRAMVRGDVDAACMIDGNHFMFTHEGTLPSGATRVVARTPAYDHCNFTVLENAPIELVNRFRDLLLGMAYSDAEVRPLLDMEGLKQWRPGRTNGYAALATAVDRFGSINAFVTRVADRCR